MGAQNGSIFSAQNRKMFQNSVIYSIHKNQSSLIWGAMWLQGGSQGLAHRRPVIFHGRICNTPAPKLEYLI